MVMVGFPVRDSFLIAVAAAESVEAAAVVAVATAEAAAAAMVSRGSLVETPLLCSTVQIIFAGTALTKDGATGGEGGTEGEVGPAVEEEVGDEVDLDDLEEEDIVSRNGGRGKRLE